MIKKSGWCQLGCQSIFALAAMGFMASTEVVGQDTKQKGFLGVAVETMTGERGIVVREVTADAPADKAGLKVGDRIVKLADKDVDDIKRFLAAVAATKPGEKMALRVVRAGKEQDINVIIGDWPRDKRIEPAGGSDTNRRIRELERRVEELERRLRELDKKQESK